MVDNKLLVVVDDKLLYVKISSWSTSEVSPIIWMLFMLKGWQ